MNKNRQRVFMNPATNKRGTILVENVLFIVLNLVFLSILFLFLFSKMESAAVLEERYAKQIALIIDAAKPGMMISLDMKDAIEKTEKEEINEIVKIIDNIVTVKLRYRGGYSYSFFNDIEITNYYFVEDKSELVLVMERYNA